VAIDGYVANRLAGSLNPSVCVSAAGETPMPKNITAVHRELVALDGMTVGELAEKYLEVFGEPSRSRNKAYLQKKIAWRIQELAEGGLSERAKRRIAELAEEAPIRQRPAREANRATDEAARDPRLPKPGTVLKRTHGGREHVVTVHADDFEYRAKRYSSLSAIAKAITDTNWNGLLFFGLTTRRISKRREGERAKGT
jgi:hypothetical protein